MLVLRRKVGERIVLGTTITIAVLSIEGGRVKIGITAPASMSVVREELLSAAPRSGGVEPQQGPQDKQSLHQRGGVHAQ